MLCAISGEAPTVPVASKKSGHVYEKRLIESHLAANHTDPITGEELDASDLIALQSPRVVKPRPPTLTSIPALLSTFQNEWDALMFETYTLKQMVTQAKQELSTALYENDAAVRVIARVTRERNEARDALSKMGVAQMRSGAVVETATNGQAGEAMQVDGQGTGLPKEHAEMIDEIQASLSKARRKRPVPETWTPVEKIQAFAIQSKETRLVPNGSKAMATDTNIDKGGMQVVLGGNDGSVCIYNFPRDETMRVFDAGQGMVNDCLCVDFESKLRSAFALATGEVKLFDSDNLVVAFTDHAGSANALALHPGGQILASVGDDKTVVLYDVFAKTKLTQFATDHSLTTCKFHPDGALLAAGSRAGTVSIFTVKSASKEHTFEFSGPVSALSFSENGLWLAVAVQGSPTVEILNLNKMATIHSLDFGTPIDALEFDYSGQYLAGGGQGSIGVFAYDKGAKAWSQPVTRAANVASLHWGPSAKGLVILTTDGSVRTVR